MFKLISDVARCCCNVSRVIDSVLHLPARDPSKPAYDVIAILDPATRAAQKYTPLIMVNMETNLCKLCKPFYITTCISA